MNFIDIFSKLDVLPGKRGVYQGKLEITELAEFGQISLGKGKFEVTKVNKFYSE